MSVSLAKHEPYAGKDLGEIAFICTPTMVEDYCEGLAVDRARYQSPTYWERPAAPAMIVGEVDGGFEGARFDNAFGNLWMRQEWDFHQPIFPGHEYRRASTVLDVYEWRNRSVVKQEVRLYEGEELIVRGTHHQSYLLGQSSGKVALRDPKKKEGVRKFEVPRGESVASVVRNIDLEMCGVEDDQNPHQLPGTTPQIL